MIVIPRYLNEETSSTGVFLSMIFGKELKKKDAFQMMNMYFVLLTVTVRRIDVSHEDALV